VASRGCSSHLQAREARTPPAGHHDPCCEELAVRSSEEMPRTEARIRSQDKSPRWSAERRASPAHGTRHASQAWIRCAPFGAPPPLGWGWLAKTRALRCRGKDGGCVQGVLRDGKSRLRSGKQETKAMNERQETSEQDQETKDR
jgi:hypothetical protein